MRIEDMVIVLPGITGSVLARDGREVWAISGRAISEFLRTRGDSLQNLRLGGVDDPTLDDLGDGIRAASLMPDAHIVPGLWKIDGYGLLTRTLRESFELEPGANYFEFPYDWRRDNRVAARALEKLIHRTLPAWRQASGAADAKVILLAHSMGGLICRYYLEVMEGWRNCRALITFGTPYRGSLKALNYLFNGHRLGFVDLSSVLRSCTSVYQLLPTYKVCRAGENSVYVHELPSSEFFSTDRARQARTFHDAIAGAVRSHRELGEYRDSFRMLPVIGVRQPTLNSATFDGATLKALTDLPEGLDARMEDGDGTVPRVSAIPLEWSSEFGMLFQPESHGSLQNNPQVLTQLLEWITQSQVRDLRNFRGVDARPQPPFEPPYLRMALEDSYSVGHSIPIEVSAGGLKGRLDRVIAKVYPSDPAVHMKEATLQALADDRWKATLEGLPEGSYRVRVVASGESPPPPLADVFSVTGQT